MDSVIDSQDGTTLLQPEHQALSWLRESCSTTIIHALLWILSIDVVVNDVHLYSPFLKVLSQFYYKY